MPARREPGPALPPPLPPLLSLLPLLPLLLLLLLEPGVGQSLPPSPCPAFYSYEMNGKGEMVGLISLLTPPRYSDVRLVAKLSSPVPVQRNEVGELAIRGGREGAMQATRSVLAGRRHALYYHLRFPPNRPVPTLLTLTVNDYEICSNRNPPSSGRATITLQAFLNTGVSSAPQVDGHEFGAVQNNVPEPQFPSNRPEEPQELPPDRPRPPPSDVDPYIPRPTTTTTTTTRRPRPPPTPPPFSQPESPGEETQGNPYENPVDPANCGSPTTTHNALVVFGMEAKKGAWPWQTAIFRNNDSESSSVTLHFQCGGTLVSARHVVTAAHCVVMVRERKKTQLIANTDLLVSLGKYNIRNWAEREQQLKEVKKIMTHPQYNPDILRNDIAIIELSTKITINEFVKPICLWDRPPDLDRIVGDVGTVGGWGRDETGSLSDKLRIANMRIESQETCLRSDNSFYIKYTSESTFCAGFRNGTTVCNGDSGGGLHLRMENSNQDGRKTWYLRGIVSLSMLEVGEQTCDTHNFVVFTDVAKYMTWIYQHLR